MANADPDENRGRRVEFHEFDIELGEDSLYHLTLNDDHILTLAGDPVTHRSRLLVQQIIDEFDGQGRIAVDYNKIVQPNFNLSYTIMCVQQHVVERGQAYPSGFGYWLSGDPLLHSCAGPEQPDQRARWEPAVRYLNDLGLELVTLGFFVDWPEAFDSTEEYEQARRTGMPPQEFSDRLQQEYDQLLSEEKAVVVHLSCIHKGNVILSLALVSGRCSPNEYAAATLAANSILADTFPDVKVEDHRSNFDEVRNHANVALSYIRAAGISGLTTRYILNQSISVEETRTCELKEIRGRNPVDAIKNTADEYVVSFLNSEGGRIVWGVRDSDRVVIGVQLDFGQRDRLRRDVVSKLNEIQPKIDPTQYRLTIHPVIDEDAPSDNLFVVEIHVPTRDTNEPYYTGGNECFVRVDGSKKKLAGPALTDWIRQKIKEGGG